MFDVIDYDILIDGLEKFVGLFDCVCKTGSKHTQKRICFTSVLEIM